MEVGVRGHGGVGEVIPSGGLEQGSVPNEVVKEDQGLRATKSGALKYWKELLRIWSKMKKGQPGLLSRPMHLRRDSGLNLTVSP